MQLELSVAQPPNSPILLVLSKTNALLLQLSEAGFELHKGSSTEKFVKLEISMGLLA
jgi:hypothetical protein